MNNINIGHGDRYENYGLLFRVTIEHDEDAGAPWENSDGHGPVSDWVTRDKRPGELVLNSDRGSRRFYDYAAAVALAKRDGWDAAPYGEPGETKGQRAARAALSDFEYLRAWCADDWRYVVVGLQVIDETGRALTHSHGATCAYLGGVEDRDGDYIREVVRNLAEEIAADLGKYQEGPQ